MTRYHLCSVIWGLSMRSIIHVNLVYVKRFPKALAGNTAGRYRNRSWPAVSQICSLTVLPPTLTTREPNSTPMVWLESCLTAKRSERSIHIIDKRESGWGHQSAVSHWQYTATQHIFNQITSMCVCVCVTVLLMDWIIVTVAEETSQDWLHQSYSCQNKLWIVWLIECNSYLTTTTRCNKVRKTWLVMWLDNDNTLFQQWGHVWVFVGSI